MRATLKIFLWLLVCVVTVGLLSAQTPPTTQTPQREESTPSSYPSRTTGLAALLKVGVQTTSAEVVAGRLRAACVKVNITPDKPQWLMGYRPRLSEGIHDNLYHRIVAMDDGKTQFFLVSTDILVFPPSFYDEFCKELEKETGIEAGQVWWTVTHTHSAPEVSSPDRYTHVKNPEYTKWVKDALIEGLREARSKLEPARFGVGIGTSLANINRREMTADGQYQLGANPEGPVDRQIGLIRLERLDGSLVALIANYAMHATVLGEQSSLISADAPGLVAEYVEEKIGAPMLYINGAEGNIAPIYSGFPDFESSHIDEFNTLLGDKILEANRSICTMSSDVRFWIGETVIETPRKADFEYDLGDYSRVTNEGVNLVRIPVYFLKINSDIAIWGAPVELFCEIAMNVRDQSPYPYTFYFGLTNGTLPYQWYLPTKQAFAEGGFEPSVSPFTRQAEEDFTQGVTTYLQGMPR